MLAPFVVCLWDAWRVLQPSGHCATGLGGVLHETGSRIAGDAKEAAHCASRVVVIHGEDLSLGRQIATGATSVVLGYAHGLVILKADVIDAAQVVLAILAASFIAGVVLALMFLGLDGISFVRLAIFAVILQTTFLCFLRQCGVPLFTLRQKAVSVFGVVLALPRFNCLIVLSSPSVVLSKQPLLVGFIEGTATALFLLLGYPSARLTGRHRCPRSVEPSTP
jgi:hypothetical protein